MIKGFWSERAYLDKLLVAEDALQVLARNLVDMVDRVPFGHLWNGCTVGLVFLMEWPNQVPEVGVLTNILASS